MFKKSKKMSSEAFCYWAKVQLKKEFKTLTNAAKELGVTYQVLSESLSHQGRTPAKKVPKAVLEYLGYERKDKTETTYEQLDNG